MTDEQRGEVRPSGTVEREADGPWLVVTRRFDAPAADVWADLTVSGRLERWVGRWEGDPASGGVQFFMSAEDPDAGPEECRIVRCDPPHRLDLVTSTGDDEWHLGLHLDEEGGTTTLRFRQRLDDGSPASSVGPGWEYYLARLEAVRGGAAAESVSWDDYYPALGDHYAQAQARA
jgi:uncharacterized protein YndB with AHSA1/START domain